MRALLLLIPLLACGPKQVSANALEAPPKLPAPRAAAYVSVQTEPTDPVVARLAKGHRWNETLSGAAAGLALDWVDGLGDLSAWQVREATWQAGWAWPVVEIRGWVTSQAEPPPEELVRWLDALEPEDTLGLVRARGRQGDGWVALRARPRAEMDPQPRQVPIDGQLVFSRRPGVKLTVADPVGSVATMTLDAERVIHADHAGEWLFELRSEEGLIALFPIYAGMVPPETTVLSRRESGVASPEEAAAGFREILTQIREVYGLDPYGDDVLIQAAAASVASGRTATATAEIATRLGYDPDTTWKITCRARTLTDCADQVLWNPRARPALLAERAHLGLAATLVGDGVHVVVLVAAH